METDAAGERGRAVAALITVQLLFGVHYSVAIEIVDSIDPAAWVVLRVVGAAVVLALLVPATGRAWPRGGKNWIELALLGTLGVAINQIFFIEGISRSYSLHSVLVMATVPLQTLLFATLLRQERPSLGTLGSVLIGAAGIVFLLGVDVLIDEGLGSLLLTNQGESCNSVWDSVLGGDLMMLLNSSSFSLFLVLGKKPAARLDPLCLTAATFAVATPVVVIYGGRELAALDLSRVPWTIWGWGAFAILGPTVTTYLLNFYAVRRVSSSLVGLFIYLQFVVAAVIGVAWRKEFFSWRIALAAILVLGGLSLRFLLFRQQSRPR